MMSHQFSSSALVVAAVVIVAFAAVRSQGTVGKQDVEGITNFTRLDATVACAGATRASAVPALKKEGFKSIVNLRRASEAGADVEGERAAATAAGLNYYHFPFAVPKGEDPSVNRTVQEFLEVVKNRENQPVFIHCAGGGRAAGFWLIKRVMIDGWDVARARQEANLVSSDPNSASINWAEQYARTHKQ
jgi:protein tyrosine phosphatase (PTP) superfamily phosphohydrolase (DUF442 family)